MQERLCGGWEKGVDIGLAQIIINESINQFNQTVLTAVQETDNAMNSYRNSIKQIVALREVRNQGIETLKLSLEPFRMCWMHSGLCCPMRISWYRHRGIRYSS